MFKDRFKDFQYLVKELEVIRRHNLAFNEGYTQQQLLLFAEGALVLLTLERFLRILPGVESTESDTLFNLLQKATSSGTLTLPAESQTDAIKQITKIRNTILHGNFEQAARETGLNTVEEYFKTQFVAEVEALYKITNNLVAQIDTKTGKPNKCSNRS